MMSAGLLVKDGAEGVLGAAMPAVGAVAVKIADGSQRARTPLAVEALRFLGVDVSGLDALATGRCSAAGVRSARSGCPSCAAS